MEDSNGGSKASVAATVIDKMNSITDFFSVPDEGTPLRPIVRSCRVAFESTFSDLTKTANTEAKSLAANIQTQALGAQESISKEVSPILEKVVDTKVVSSPDFLKGAEVRPSLKLGASCAALALLSYKFGPRVFLRNTIVGGSASAAYFYPDTPQRAWNYVTGTGRGLYEKYVPKF